MEAYTIRYTISTVFGCIQFFPVLLNKVKKKRYLVDVKL